MYRRIPRQEEARICEAIGKNIRKAREEMRMTLTDVAKRLDYPKSKLSEIENGKKEPTAILLAIMAELFDVSVLFFYTGNDESVFNEKLFDMRRVLQPLREEMNSHLSRVALEIWAKQFPSAEETANLVEAAENMTAQGLKMIERNRDDAWQDIKGGVNFEIQLKCLRNAVKKHKSSVHYAQRVRKEAAAMANGQQEGAERETEAEAEYGG